jgi:hypothetical protein
MSKILEISGQRFNRLIAIECVGSNKQKRRLWKCICDCGNEKILPASLIVSETVKSCGCLADEMRVSANTKHGDCRTRLYRIWKGIISRCTIESSTDYKWYGAKGVSVCDEWRNYINFKEWAMNNGYTDTLTIDRIDPYGNYEPSNCRWATTKEQNMNRRKDKTNGIFN